MTGFEIAALVAMLAGTAIQYRETEAANDRTQAAIRRSLEQQDNLSKEAESNALDAASKYRTEDRMAEQAQVADELTTQMLAPVAESQAIRADSQKVQGEVSSDYQVAKAKSDAQTLKATEQLARLLGKTTSASRLRMNEGIRLMDAGIKNDQLNSFARGQAGADQIAIQQAGVTDAGNMAIGGILKGLGAAGMSYGGSDAGLNGGQVAAANASNDPIATANALKGWTGGSAGNSWMRWMQ